ncbi:hypothetical protein [Bradyrhizobium sp. URHC0002]
MPVGISHPGLGYATFCAIKFVGYTAAAQVLSVSYNRDDLASWKVGAVRTLIGMAAGAGYYGLWRVLGPDAFRTGAGYDSFPYLYLAGLLPVRIAEWWLLIFLFYDRKLRQPARGWRMVGLGTIWSYVLDAPAMAGFIATAGFWVC